MPPKKVPKGIAYFLFPVFALWTGVNVYVALSDKYGFSARPHKTKFLIEESDTGTPK